MNFDWNELAFTSKSAVNKLNAVFIIAPREISQARFVQLVKQYLPKGNLLIGLAKEPYVIGLENQLQFKMLKLETVVTAIKKVNESASKHKIYTLAYSQRELPFVIEKLVLASVVGVNGSWLRSFHLRPEYYEIAKKRLNLELVSAFADETEAKSYAAKIEKSNQPKLELPKAILSASEVFNFASRVAACSFDYTGQVGAALARKSGNKYKILAANFNKVLPYQTFSMYNGSSREGHFSPAGDLNYYDSIHAEAGLIANAARKKLDLSGATLFVTVSPCPNCSLLLSQTGIAAVIYNQQHSTAESARILAGAGIKLIEA